MGIRPEIMRQFLDDSQRLCKEARASLGKIEKARKKKSDALEPVQAFYRIVHTVKGTASMLPSGKGIVEALQILESQLTCRPLNESAQKLDWLPLAEEAIERAERELAEMRDSQPAESPTAPVPAARKGFQVQARSGDHLIEAWYPLGAILRVYGPSEMRGSDSALFDGRWVPVLGSGPVGLALSTQKGVVIVAVEQVLGIGPAPAA